MKANERDVRAAAQALKASKPRWSWTIQAWEAIARIVLEAVHPKPPDVVSAERIILGHCPNPECGPHGGAPIAVLNNHEVWSPAECKCGWSGDASALVNRYRLDRGWRVSDGHGGPERELRP